jgi:hypothetical protein
MLRNDYAALSAQIETALHQLHAVNANANANASKPKQVIVGMHVHHSSATLILTAQRQKRND